MAEPANTNEARRSWLGVAELALVVTLMAGDFYGLVPVTSTPFLLALAPQDFPSPGPVRRFPAISFDVLLKPESV